MTSSKDLIRQGMISRSDWSSLDDGFDDCCLALEIMINMSSAHTGGQRDIRHAGAPETIAAEARSGGIEDLLSPAPPSRRPCVVRELSLRLFPAHKMMLKSVNILWIRPCLQHIVIGGQRFISSLHRVFTPSAAEGFVQCHQIGQARQTGVDLGLLRAVEGSAGRQEY